MINPEKSQQYVAENRQETIQTLLNFLQCDVLLFWSEKEELNKIQQEQWLPLLQMLKDKFSLNLQITSSIIVPDNSMAINSLAKLFRNMSDKELTVCLLCSKLLKSVLSGFMIAQKQLSAEKAFDVVYVEEYYQNKYWGMDTEAEKERRQIREELLQIEEYLNGKMS